MSELKVLELFSGIGGMHEALMMSKINGNVKSAIDINESANKTYSTNFPATPCISKNIQMMEFKHFSEINCIFMSPPCQPFSRQGHFSDINDSRCAAFITICNVIKERKMNNLEFILMENVKGFEKSRMREMFLESLKLAGFKYQEFILSPTIIGIPNTRTRYYCIARKSHEFAFKNEDILNSLPINAEKTEIEPLSNYIGPADDNWLLSDELLIKRFQVLDIQTPDSINTMCFTKAYTRYIEGTGSVFCDLSREDLNAKLAEIENSDNNLELKKALKLRFFTPTEVLSLMSFPKNFKFPSSFSDKQKYKLLGNSINVAVVSKLIKLMMT